VSAKIDPVEVARRWIDLDRRSPGIDNEMLALAKVVIAASEFMEAREAMERLSSKANIYSAKARIEEADDALAAALKGE